MTEALTLQERAKQRVEQYLKVTGRKGLTEFWNQLNEHAGRQVCTLKNLNLWHKTEGRKLGPRNWEAMSAFLASTSFQAVLNLASVEPTRSPNETLSKFDANTLSDTPFSNGLQKRLANYSAELQFLTIEQVKALESHLRFQNLWIQGAAGTGKTIFAIEAAYRALRAGSRVLMVFRSRQFYHILGELLEEVSENLSLLLHLDFMYLLRQIEMHGPSSNEFKQIAQELIPKGEQDDGNFYFDLIILDDGGTFETQMPYLIQWIADIAYKRIFLVAPEQIIDNLLPDDPEPPTVDTAKGRVYRLVSQELEAPKHFHAVQLEKNLRNCRDIVRYARRSLKIDTKPGLNELGSVREVRCTWDGLDTRLLEICADLLKTYPPGQIRILVDPFLVHPALDELPRGSAEEEFQDMFIALPPFTQGIVLATLGVSFLHSTFECEPEDIKAVLAQANDNRVFFVATDGEQIGTIDEAILEPTPQAQDFLASYQRWPSPHIDAQRILDEYALADPLQAVNAILIYPTPLFIGLESDAVIYVSTAKQDEITGAERVRAGHHFLAVSRGKRDVVRLGVLKFADKN